MESKRDIIPKICKSKLKKRGELCTLIFEKNSLIHAINIYFQMFYLALTSCLFTLALGFVAHESHAHAHLPGFCNNLDCPRFSVLQTFKVNKCIIYISHNQWLIFRSCRIALISLFFGESIRNWYFPCLISQNAYFVFYVLLKEGYELRQYESSKWVMTNLTAMIFTDDDDKEMFDKLFYYISGNNSIRK